MLIDEIRNGESAALEFKRSMPEEALKVLKTACAFANCSGGRIVVGVDDDRTVVVYDDRVEVTSPGGLPHGISLEMMMTGHSRSRNRALALAFRYMRFIESWGSGIPRVQKMLLDRKLNPLTVEDNGSDMRFVIWRPVGRTILEANGTVTPCDSTVNSTVTACNSTVDSTVSSRDSAVDSTAKPDGTPPMQTLNDLSPALQRLVAALGNDTLGSRQLCERLHQKSRGALMQTYLRPAIKMGLVEVIGGKTHSSRRAYRIRPKA